MGITDRKLALVREIERREKTLAKLESLPDFEEMVDGTVLALFVTLGRSDPYTYVALKIAEKWNVTGNTGPNAVSSDGLGEWLVTGGRRLEGLFTLAVLQTPKTQVVDLGALLLSGISEYQTRGDSFVSVCMDDSCGCSGQAHP